MNSIVPLLEDIVPKRLASMKQKIEKIAESAAAGSTKPSSGGEGGNGGGVVTKKEKKKNARLSTVANATNDIDAVQLTFLGSRLIIPYPANHTPPYELVAWWKIIFTFLDLRQYRLNRWTAKNQYVFQLRTCCRLFDTVLQSQKTVAVDLRKEATRKLTISDKSSKPAKKSRKWTTGDFLRAAIVKQADACLNLNDIISTTDVFGQFVRPDLSGKLL